MKLVNMLICLSLLHASITFAGNTTNDFKCTVKAASNVGPEGNIESVELWNFYINQEFTVDRKSGIVTGNCRWGRATLTN